MPNSVFAPYATVATNLLFFTKGQKTKEIWYYEHRLPTGQKAYSKTKPIAEQEFEAIIDWWHNRCESEVAWKVDIADIEARNFDLDIKNPNKKEQQQEFSSAELIKMLTDSFDETKKILAEIKEGL